MKRLLTLFSLLVFLASCNNGIMDELEGVYSLSGSESVVWGGDNGILNVNGTIRITSIGKNTFMMEGYYQTTGRVVGNTLYFDSYRESDYSGYYDVNISSAYFSGNGFSMTVSTSGMLPYNGIRYPYRGRANVRASKRYY